MKRDWDTIRRIMGKVEALQDDGAFLGCDDVAGLDQETCAYHMRLMIEANLATGAVVGMSAPAYVRLNRLTWAGHELLDSIRKDTVWNKIKETARVKGVDLTVDALKAIAGMVLSQWLG